MTEDSLFLPGLSPVEGLDFHARFDGGALSSDGGVLLLREIERDLKFADTLAACLHDTHERLPFRETRRYIAENGVVAWSVKRSERALPETDFRRCVQNWDGQVRSSG